MNIRPVNSEQAYDEAIERIETLWGAESGTPEGDELDVLLTLVRVYEKENHPVPPPPTPIEAISCYGPKGHETGRSGALHW